MIEVRLAFAWCAFLSVALVAIGASCNGCAPQCQGEQRAAGCPCESDQDCTTKGGVVLLCTSSTCTAGNPPDAPGTKCTSDGECLNGNGCGVDDVCVPAPKCQRIDEAAAPLSFVVEPSGGSGALSSASHNDCTHSWSSTSAKAPAAALVVDVAIGLDGSMTVTDKGSTPVCTGGTWHVGQRVGELDCGGVTWFIGPADALDAACNVDAGTCL